MQTYTLEPLLRGQPWHFKWGSLLLGIEIKYVYVFIVKYPFQFYIMFAHGMLTSQFFFFSGYRRTDGPLSGSQSAVHLRMYRSGDASVSQFVQRESYQSTTNKHYTMKSLHHQ